LMAYFSIDACEHRRRACPGGTCLSRTYLSGICPVAFAPAALGQTALWTKSIEEHTR
jgi:hypothetical protein